MRSSAIQEMTTLISLVEDLRSNRRLELQEQVKKLLETFPAAARKSRVLFKPNFNMMKLCGLGADEVRHSAILAWLLDENASHAHGNLFLEAFSSVVGLELENETAGYVVSAEFPGFESITDIVVYRTSDFFISIENKINAKEGGDQLNREYRDRERYADSLNIPPNRRVSVFLTPDGRQPKTGNPHSWCQLSYSRMAEAFRTISYQNTGQKLRFFVEDWFASIKNNNE